MELAETATKIREVVGDNLKQSVEFVRLKKKHANDVGEKGFLRHADGGSKQFWTYNKIEVKTIDEIYDRYPTDKDYKTEHQEELDREVNKKLKCWKGDVSTAPEDVEKIRDDLQSDLDSDKEDDSDLEKFKEELDEIDWGEKELGEIEPDDPVEKVERVIKALEKLKQEVQRNEE